MQLNQTTAENVRRETFNGREFLVAPVRAMKAMNLDGGYVPAEHVAKSAEAWNGIPVTLNHPRSPQGNLTSANSPDIAEKTWLGYYFNATYDADTTALDGEVWVDAAAAEEAGGEAGQIVEMLRNGERIAVSTAYFADRLEPGEYDGEYREEVAGNLAPDHLALLPNKDGKCSVDDGCMAGDPAPAVTAANGLVVTNADAAQNCADSCDCGGDPTDDPGNAGEVSGTPAVAHDRDGSQQPMNGETDENPSGSASDPASDADAESFGTRAGKAFARQLDRIGFNNDSTETMDRNDKIDVLVNQHGYDEDSLDGMGDSCLDRTYNAFTNDDDAASEADADADAESADVDATEAPDTESDADTDADEEADAESTTDDGEQTDPTMTEDDKEAIKADLRAELTEELREEITAEMAANEEAQQRESLISEITANDDSYDAEALAETPVDVLENIRDDVQANASAVYAAQRGAAAQPAANEDDAADFPALSVNEHSEEEGDN